MSQRKSVLDPARVEHERWVDKKADRDPNRVRSTAMIMCSYCPMPIGEHELMFDLKGERACLSCAKKYRELEKQHAASTTATTASK
jgi:hypothetical protein